MTRNPVSAFVAVSIDAIRDAMGESPPALTLGGALVRTTSGGAGKGQRPYFACPACERRVLLLFFPRAGGPPACRWCHRVTYPSQQFHRTRLKPYLAAIRRSFA